VARGSISTPGSGATIHGSFIDHSWIDDGVYKSKKLEIERHHRATSSNDIIERHHRATSSNDIIERHHRATSSSDIIERHHRTRYRRTVGGQEAMGLDIPATPWY